ncbi:hypothetical protein ATANTOWER_026736 [Ataeniobius toweri]|uniref:Uncharacterized protein n=1 Tax=Ataeniobius toweri TaxID=208326 RepID=A0ABU7AS64_9TELE|nr:hypothetical protein [Ataeniobius toweri]
MTPGNVFRSQIISHVAAAAQLRLWMFYSAPYLHCICSGPVRSPEELQEPYADGPIKASEKYGSKSKTSHSVEVKPVKLLHFSFYASRYFHGFCSTMDEFTEFSEALFLAKCAAFNV